MKNHILILTLSLFFTSSCGEYSRIKLHVDTMPNFVKTDALLTELNGQEPLLTYSSTGESSNQLRIESEGVMVSDYTTHTSGTKISAMKLEFFKNYTLILKSFDAQGLGTETYRQDFRLSVDDDFDTVIKSYWTIFDQDEYDQPVEEPVAEVSNGILTLRGRGEDVLHFSHEFVGIYLNDVKNDFDVYVKLNETNETSGFLKAGLIVANNWSEFSEQAVVMCTQTLSNDVFITYSSQDDAFLDAGGASGNNNKPKFIRMKKVGNQISCYMKELEADPWVELVGSPITRAFASSFDLGVMGVSHNVDETGIFKFEDFKEIIP